MITQRSKDEIIDMYKHFESETVYDKTEITLLIIDAIENDLPHEYVKGAFYIMIHDIFKTVDEYVISTYNTNLSTHNTEEKK